MEFPERLRALRREARLSQRELAEKIGVDFTYLSKIENRRVEPPSEAVLRRISEELARKAWDESDRACGRANKHLLERCLRISQRRYHGIHKLFDS